MSTLRHGAPLAMNGFMDKEGRKLRGRKTRYFKLRDSALFNHRRKDAPASWGVSLIDSRVAVGHKGEVIVQLFDGKKILVFPHSRSDSDVWVDLLQRAARRKIGNFYGVTGLIGMGSFAEVRIGYDKDSGDQVAIKVMKKNKRDTELMRSVECEMNFISKNIDHENIVKTYDVFDTRDNLFIVMEYMPGGMLYDILATEGQFSERDAAAIMRDLLEAVHCLHSYDIVHRDIKPENVLALNKSFPLKTKLADFGLADFVLENSFGEKSTCGMYGTPFFVAPEVIRAETYTPAVDIWSLGVLVYNMLSGKLPFDGSHIKEVLRKVRAGRYEFPDSQWKDISADAKQFINGLLELDPHNRLTAHQALAHPWLNDDQLSSQPIQNDRSALGYDQRKLRMSSMAIDDVAALLDMDDEEDDQMRGITGPRPHSHGHGANSGLSALTRLFPGRSGGKSGGLGSASSSRQSNNPSLPISNRPPRHDSHQSFSTSSPSSGRRSAGAGAKLGSPGSTKRRTSDAGVVVVPRLPHQDLDHARRSSLSPPSVGSGCDSEGYTDQNDVKTEWNASGDDLLPPLHPLIASGKINDGGNLDSYAPEDMDDPFGRKGDLDSYHVRAALADTIRSNDEMKRDSDVAQAAPRNGYTADLTVGQEEDVSAYNNGGYNMASIGGMHYGGLEANPGFTLPAILSAKVIRQQRTNALAANHIERSQRAADNAYRGGNHSDDDM